MLPLSNIGRFLRDGEECLHLAEGDGVDIAAKLERLIRNPGLRERIGAGGRKFASCELNWDTIAPKLHRFYDRVLAAQTPRPVKRAQPAVPAPIGLVIELSEYAAGFDFAASRHFDWVSAYSLHADCQCNGDVCDGPSVHRKVGLESLPPADIIGYIAVWGWAADSLPGVPIKRVTLAVNDVTAGSAVLGTQRDDVAEHLSSPTADAPSASQPRC